MRMTDRECVLRFLAFKLSSPRDYSSGDDLDSFLNDRMQQINRLGTENQDPLERLRNDFKRAMKLAAAYIWQSSLPQVLSAESRRSQVSKALFEVWSVNLDKLMMSRIEILSPPQEPAL